MTPPTEPLVMSTLTRSASDGETFASCLHGLRSYTFAAQWWRICTLSVILIATVDASITSGATWNPLNIEFVAKCDQTRQKYVLVLPEDFSSDKKHDVLIALHGHGSDRWQFINQQRDECRAARRCPFFIGFSAA